jgi:hypothetical protein
VGGACAQASTSYFTIRSRTTEFEPTKTAIMSKHNELTYDWTSTIARQPGAPGKKFLFEARIANSLPKSLESGIQIEQM